MWALESAMDELPFDLGMDPLDLRIAQLCRDRPRDRGTVVFEEIAGGLRRRRSTVRLARPSEFTAA